MICYTIGVIETATVGKTIPLSLHHLCAMFSTMV